MAKKIVELKNNDGSSFFIEADDNENFDELIAADASNLARATNKLEDSLTPVLTASKTILARITESAKPRPSEVELTFSIKLSGNLNFWVIAGNGEGSISLKLKWTEKK